MIVAGQQITSRTLLDETADRRVYQVVGIDGDGDPFTAEEVELKIDPAADLIARRDVIVTALANYPPEGSAANRASLETALDVINTMIGGPA